MNVSHNHDWRAFKAQIIRSLGHEGAAAWLVHQSKLIEAEQRRRVIDAEAREVERAP